MWNKALRGFLILAALFPLPFMTGLAYAQQNATSAAVPRIEGFNVEPVAQPAPGTELAFTLYGSPGGVAAVQIGGATGGLTLEETDAGIYEGVYTIRKRDQITATSTVTANLRLGNRVASALLDEPLIDRTSARRTNPAARLVTPPKIERFDAYPPARLAPGEELTLRLSGSPGGTASARIAGIKGKIVLNEIRSGVYEGSYTIRSRDRIATDSVVKGNLRLGNRETSMLLGQPLLTSSGYQASARQAARLCVNCGVVEAINLVEVKGDGSYLGKIAGGVVGALLGSQIGHGKGTTVAEVAGAAGGVYVGNEIEKRMKTTKHYDVVVRLENGGSRTISYATQPGFAVGARVRVENDTLALVP